MYYYYNLVYGHNQLFVSAIRDNYYRGFDLFMSILEKFVERLRELLTDHEMKPAHLAKELVSHGKSSAAIPTVKDFPV